MIPTHLYEDYILFVLRCVYPLNVDLPAFIVRRSLLYDKFPVLRMLAVVALEYFPNGYVEPLDYTANEKFKLALCIMSEDYTEHDFTEMKSILGEFYDRGQKRVTCTRNAQ